MKEDRIFSHATEQIYSFMAQENEFYTGSVMSAVCAKQEYLGLDYFPGNFIATHLYCPRKT